MRVRYLYAAPAEGDSIAADLDAVCVGVGKSAAAVGSMAALTVEPRPSLVVLFGVCGAYPARHGVTDAVEVGDLCVVGDDRFADEGVATPRGFESLDALGLGTVGPFAADPASTARLAGALEAPTVHGATVSTCSGTDALSQVVSARTRAQVETMEGAAVALACDHLGMPMVHIRCVSNRTGDRAAAGWDLPLAASRIQAAVLRIHAILTGGDQ